MSPPKREALLDELGKSEPELAGALVELLALSERSGDFLSDGAAAARDELLKRAVEQYADDNVAGTDRVGQTVGHYRLIRILGRGARSTVYLAERTDGEWDEKVAVKILARGINTDDVLRRFLAERQILSQLRHPHIASLLDGGSTEDGLPYFVMEHIDGLSITHFCQRHKLGLRDRVRLFLQVCETVAFAERHLVVHRDIKPSNILVDEQGDVKLLDFGIAKLLDPAANPSISPLTVELARPMTPAYASPEQVRGEAVTTATDTWQLGLLLAELLLETSNPKRALGLSNPEDSPARPSRWLSEHSGHGLAQEARDLQGDLDWIVLKALEPVPADRYPSAAKLAADIEQFLQHRAISARAPSPLYRLRKFVHRRPALSASLALLGAALIAYLGLIAFFNVQLEQQRQTAVAAAERAEQVKNLLVQFFTAPDPYEGQGFDTRVADVLQQSESFIRSELGGQPELEAELLAVLSEVYQRLDQHERAIELLESEIALRENSEAGRSIEWVRAERKRAVSLVAQGKLDEGLALLKAVEDKARNEFPEATTELAIIELENGKFQRRYGKVGDGVPYLQSAVTMLRQSDDQPLLLVNALQELAFAFGDQRDYDASHELLQEALRTSEQAFGPAHLQTQFIKTRIAANLTNRGHYEESIAIYREVVPILEDRLGPAHSRTLQAMGNMAFSHDLNGQLELALPIFEEVLARKRGQLGNEHRDVADSLQNLGSLSTRMGNLDAAIAYLQEAARIFRRVNDPGNPATAYPYITLAILFSRKDDVEQLELNARTAESLLDGNVPENHPAWLKTRCLLGEAHARQGDFELGVTMLEESIQGLEAHKSISPTHIEDCRIALGKAENGAFTSVSDA